MPNLSFGFRDASALQVGLDSSGKTTLVHRLKTGEVTIAVPTTGELVLETGW